MSKSAKTYRLDDLLIEELEVTANKRGVSMTSIVEDAIQAYIQGCNTSVCTSSNIYQTDDKAISALFEQLDRKDRQIEDQARHISELMTALDKAQDDTRRAQTLHGAEKLQLSGTDTEQVENAAYIVNNPTDKDEKTGRRGLLSWLFGDR